MFCVSGLGESNISRLELQRTISWTLEIAHVLGFESCDMVMMIALLDLSSSFTYVCACACACACDNRQSEYERQRENT